MLWVSTTGDSAETVMVSSSAPTFMSALTLAVKSDVSSMPSRTTTPKPVNENVIL